jgi:hypothetical protein
MDGKDRRINPVSRMAKIRIKRLLLSAMLLVWIASSRCNTDTGQACQVASLMLCSVGGLLWAGDWKRTRESWEK